MGYNEEDYEKLSDKTKNWMKCRYMRYVQNINIDGKENHSILKLKTQQKIKIIEESIKKTRIIIGYNCTQD